MYIALVHEHYNQKHLEEVIEEMKTLGVPTIKAFWDECDGIWVACEGCHRIRAAKELGLTPEIEDVTETETIVIDWDGDPDTEIETSEVIETLIGRLCRAEIIKFEE